MISGLIGKKLGMTQIFDKEGNIVPVVVIEAGPCTVLELKDAPARIKLGFGVIKESHVNKPLLGFFKKLGVSPLRTVKEFKSSDNKDYKVGTELKADVFKAGDFVDVTGTTIGKGFQGGMKRHGWHGGDAAHGSMHHRRIGSAGSSAEPSRVLKGHRMPGHMGDTQRTIQSLRVMDVDIENNILLIKGAVPGASNSTLFINRSKKKQFKALDEQKVVVVKKVNPMKQAKAKATGKGK